MSIYVNESHTNCIAIFSQKNKIRESLVTGKKHVSHIWSTLSSFSFEFKLTSIYVSSATG